ncbi:MAG TPA: hypothetical protein DEA55_05415 [Rhodospirillaceae bacterium]|nr:hypothetical protein [Rhodospirillaceae bacterium]
MCALVYSMSAFGVSVLARSVSAKEPKSISTLQPPPWPFPLLDKNERSARLQFVLDTQRYAVKIANQPLDGVKCQTLLEQLNDEKKVIILEPQIIATNRDDAAVPDDVIKKCPTVEFDRVWFSVTKGVLAQGVDIEFDSLELVKKDQAADFYHKKTGPIEFYNLSKYFDGKNVWATFVDQGEFVCNKSTDLCDGLEGYRLLSDVVVGAVVEPDSCKTYMPSKVKAGGSFIVSTSKPYAYKELPNFHAYIEIEERPYRLGLATTIPWSQLYRLQGGGGTTLVLEYVDPHEHGSCIYESKPN